jgi:hypothetical protein
VRSSSLGRDTVLLVWGSGLDIAFIDYLYSQLVTTSNYSATANLHTLQITTASAKSFPACCVFTCRSLVTASNSGDYSAPAHKSALNGGSIPTPSVLHSLSYRTNLVAPAVFLITLRHGPLRPHCSFSYANRCHGDVFASSSNGLRNPVYSNQLPQQRAVSRPLPSNGSTRYNTW